MSRVLKEIQDEANVLYELGLITEKQHAEMMRVTAREVKIPAPPRYTGQRILKIREKLHCSQKVFADVIGVTADTISKWERGVRVPDKIACRLLKVIEKEGFRAL